MFSAHRRVSGLFITSSTYLTYLCHGHLESSFQAILQYAAMCCQLLFSLLCWRTLEVRTHVSAQPSHSLLWSANCCSLSAFVRSTISDSVEESARRDGLLFPFTGLFVLCSWYSVHVALRRQLAGFTLLFHHADSRDLTQVIRVGGKCLYFLS